MNSKHLHARGLQQIALRGLRESPPRSSGKEEVPAVPEDTESSARASEGVRARPAVQAGSRKRNLGGSGTQNQPPCSTGRPSCTTETCCAVPAAILRIKVGLRDKQKSFKAGTKVWKVVTPRRTGEVRQRRRQKTAKWQRELHLLELAKEGAVNGSRKRKKQKSEKLPSKSAANQNRICGYEKFSNHACGLWRNFSGSHA